MGRLFAALCAEIETLTPATVATLATQPAPRTGKVAESQESQPRHFAQITESRRVASVAGVPASTTETVLAQLAHEQGIDWSSARSQMIEGDAEAGAAQLAADTGDGREIAGVALWLRLLAERAGPFRLELSMPATNYRGTAQQPDRVTCGACRHFTVDTINPAAGAGLCSVDTNEPGPALHPMAPRFCSRHEPIQSKVEDGDNDTNSPEAN